MADPDLKMILRQFYKASNSGDTAAVQALVSGENLRRVNQMMRSAFPDLQIEAEDMIVEGDKVAARLVLRGTHQGPFYGMPATGKPFAASGIAIYRIVEGRIVDSWLERDNLGILQQLGAIPGPGQRPGGAGV